VCFVQLSRPAVSTGSRGGILAHCMNHWRQKSDALYRHDAMGFHGTSCFPGCDYPIVTTRKTGCAYRTSNDRSHGSWQGGSLMSWDLRLEAREKSAKSEIRIARSVSTGTARSWRALSALKLRLVKRRRWGLRMSWRQTLFNHVQSIKTHMAYVDICGRKPPNHRVK
jgi:hypothetical protein